MCRTRHIIGPRLHLGSAHALSRLPARSVLLLRRGVHWTPAPLDPTRYMSLFSYGRCNICATARCKLSTIHPGRSLTPAPLRKALPLQSVKELRSMNTALINYSYENGPVSDSAVNCIFWNQIRLHFHILMQICTEYVKMIYV